MTNAPAYLQLVKGGSVFRLFDLKRRAFNTTGAGRNMPPSLQITDWRKARTKTFITMSPALDQGFNTQNAGSQYEKKTPIWYTHSGPQFRNEKDSHEVENMRMDHTGWFSDADCSEMFIGIVGALTHDRYIAGYRKTDSGERIYFGHVFDNERDAANYGDNAARIDAETEQEYSQRWQAAQDLDCDINEAMQDAARLFALRHHRKFGESARESLANVVETIREKREELQNEYSDIEL